MLIASVAGAPASRKKAGEAARKSLARGDRVDAGQLVLQGVRAGALDGARIHAGCVERAQLLLRRPGGAGSGGSEPLHDAAQGGVVALDKLGKAAEARVLGRERGARQPAAVREAVEVLARSAGGVQVDRIEAMVVLGAEAGGEAKDGESEQTLTARHQ